jgi:hypothetical protein
LAGRGNLCVFCDLSKHLPDVRDVADLQMASLMSVQDSVANVGSTIFSVDCFTSGETSTSPFYVKSLLFLFLVS